MRRIATIVVLVSLIATRATLVSAADYRFLASWDNRSTAVPVLAEPFIKNVTTRTNGKMTLIFAGPEAVPPFEQLQPVGSGAFHFLLTHGAYHFGTTPFLSAAEALGGDVQSRKAAGLRELVDKHYQKYGLKLISLTQTPDGAYNILLRHPIGPSGDLQGRKIRSTPQYQAVFNLLGASTVVLPPHEIYTALEKGVVDGAAWPVMGILPYRWHEVAKYLVRPAFGFSMYPIFMNLAAWKRLTDGEKKILLEEGVKLDDHGYKEFGRVAAEEEKALLANGMRITYLGDVQKAKLKQAWSNGLWEAAAQKAKKDIDELRAFAKAKGLAN